MREGFHIENIGIFKTLMNFSFFCSVTAIGVLTIDMYIAAAVIFTLLSSWILIGALATVNLMERWNLLLEGKSCARILLSLATFMIGIFLGYTYWRIFNILRRSRMQFSGSNSNCTEEVMSKKRQGEKRLFYMGVFITCSFVTLTTPYVILSIVLCAGYHVYIRYKLFCGMLYIAKSPVHCMIFLAIHFYQKCKNSSRQQVRQLRHRMAQK